MLAYRSTNDPEGCETLEAINYNKLEKWTVTLSVEKDKNLENDVNFNVPNAVTHEGVQVYVSVNFCFFCVYDFNSYDLINFRKMRFMYQTMRCLRPINL